MERAEIVRNSITGQLICCNGAPILRKHIDDFFLNKSTTKSCTICGFRRWNNGDLVYLHYGKFGGGRRPSRDQEMSRDLECYNWTCSTCINNKKILGNHSNDAMAPIGIAASSSGSSSPSRSSPPRSSPPKNVVTPTKSPARNRMDVGTTTPNDKHRAASSYPAIADAATYDNDIIANTNNKSTSITYVATKETTTAVAKNGQSCVVDTSNVLMDVVSCICMF